MLSILFMRFRPLSWGFRFNIFRKTLISFILHFVKPESTGTFIKSHEADLYLFYTINGDVLLGSLGFG